MIGSPGSRRCAHDRNEFITPVVAEDHLPREHPEQEAREERRDDQQQQHVLALGRRRARGSTRPDTRAARRRPRPSPTSGSTSRTAPCRSSPRRGTAPSSSSEIDAAVGREQGGCADAVRGDEGHRDDEEQEQPDEGRRQEARRSAPLAAAPFLGRGGGRGLQRRHASSRFRRGGPSGRLDLAPVLLVDVPPRDVRLRDRPRRVRAPSGRRGRAPPRRPAGPPTRSASVFVCP